ncbi:MAG: O-antigen ligase family protein [Pseudomonadota bacterium]|nr:O-antigen ligase family protein [Pseudomonadota bacterium]|tara:strand:- start:2002 stop:3315 length:1314 start_codon:yes stop_codon:yes gene_type:complete
MKLKSYLHFCVFTVFGLFPFWVLLTYQARDLSLVAGSFVSSFKYFLIVVFIVLSFFVSKVHQGTEGVAKLNPLSLFQLPAVFYFFWATSLTFWTFNSVLIIDVLRIQIMPIALGVFFLVFLKGRFNAYDLLEKVVTYSSFVAITALTISIFEYFHQDILVTLYKVDIAELGHADTSFGKRLLSIYENPINFGAAICFSFACFSFFLVRWKGSLGRSVLIWILIGISFLSLALTLSRTAFAVGVFVLLFLTLELARYKKLAPLVIMSVLFGIASIAVFYYFDDIAFLLKRVDSLTNLDTYTENPRVKNWSVLFADFDAWVFVLAGLGAGMSNPNGQLSLTQGTYVIENAFISNLVDFGLIGLLIYVFIILRFAYCAFKIKQPDARLFFKIFVVVFFIFSIANDFNRNQPFSFYFWFLYFLAESMVNQDRFLINKRSYE